MATNEQILKEAEYYINNPVTMEEASKKLGISKKTLQLHLKKLEEMAPETFKLVQEKKSGNIKEGNIKGGQLGKRKPAWTNEQALEVATVIINNEMTYKQAAEHFGIPSSTLYEMVKKGVKDDEIASMLCAVAEANRRSMRTDEFIGRNKKR